MALQKQDDQHEHTFSNYVRIRDVVLKTYLGRWTIGRSGERGSGISVLPAWHDDDDDDESIIAWSEKCNFYLSDDLTQSYKDNSTQISFRWPLSSSSLSSHSISMDIPYSLMPPISIVHRFRWVFKPTSCTELYIGSSWLSCFCSSYEGVDRSMSLMNSSLLLQHCPSCLVRLGYFSWWVVSACSAAAFWDAASKTRLILLAYFCVVVFQKFLILLVSVNVVQPHSSIDSTAAWKQLGFILSVRSHFYMTDRHIDRYSWLC